MKKNIKILLNLLSVIAILIPTVSVFAQPNGVDHLRGRWDGVIQNQFGGDLPFRLLLENYGPDPNDPQATLYSGCMSVGNGFFAPASAKVIDLGYEQFDTTLYSTANGSVIKLDGLFETNDVKVVDDSASGSWQTSGDNGTWTAIHHDRLNPNCPVVEIGEDLYFHVDAYAFVGVNADESRDEEIILGGSSNILSSGMQVEFPDGKTIIAPFYTDIFSPTVNFIDEFRFLAFDVGLPIVGEPYKFTLLDVLGQPIEGTTREDVWYDCVMDAPRNVSAVADTTGIHVSWDAVNSAPGFNPGGSPPIGMYQIELHPGNGFETYGANHIYSTSHIIPFAPFIDGSLGSPDGYDRGKSLSELADGFYSFDVVAFSEAVPNSDSIGLECQIRAYDEEVNFEKSGTTITVME